MPIVNLRLLYGWLELAHATICMPVFHIREGASIKFERGQARKMARVGSYE